MKIYLDIDGVLLTKQMTIPKGAIELIDFLLESFDCYWLTTHCRHGENKAIQYLSQFYHLPEILTKLEKVKPVYWLDLKTEAIDFSSDFLWLEDYPFQAEKQVLKKHNKENSLLIVDLQNTNELLRVLNEIIENH